MCEADGEEENEEYLVLIILQEIGGYAQGASKLRMAHPSAIMLNFRDQGVVPYANCAQFPLVIRNTLSDQRYTSVHSQQHSLLCSLPSTDLYDHCKM